jgi:hypothetical protein
MLLAFIACKSLNYRVLRTNIFKGGYFDMIPRVAYMGLNAYAMG